MNNIVENKEFFAFAHELADRARKTILGCLEDMRSGSFETKDDKSPVTVVDRKVEEALRGMINERYPEHGILGEEYEAQNLKAEYIWVIDPIDGTKAFVTGMPIYGSLISLTHKGYPFIGIIEHPVTSERWAGMDGTSTTYNDEPVHTRQCSDLSEAIVSIGNPESLGQSEAEAFLALRQATKWGIYGGNCYIYGRLAMGRCDLSLDCGLDPFDFCALDVVVRGAGGVMTDWKGERLSIHSGHCVIAGGDAKIHAEALKRLK